MIQQFKLISRLALQQFSGSMECHSPLGHYPSYRRYLTQRGAMLMTWFGEAGIYSSSILASVGQNWAFDINGDEGLCV